MSSIFQVLAASDTVKVKGLDIPVKALSLSGLVGLMARFPEMKGLENADVDAMLEAGDASAIKALAAICALATEPENADQAEAHILANLGPDEMMAIVSKSFELMNVTIPEDFSGRSASPARK